MTILKNSMIGNMTRKKEEGSWIEKIEKKFCITQSFEPVALSLIIPTHNSFERISRTLESIKRQKYPNLEVIIVDADSKDHTLEIIGRFFPFVSRVYAVKTFHLPEMMNHGISLATGKYITFLFPGSFYLNDQALLLMAQAVKQEGCPGMVYAGTIQKQIGRPGDLIYTNFSLDLLKRGILPATLLASFFHQTLLDKVGKFNPHYSMRTDLDFFCRLIKKTNERIFMMDHVLVDYDYGIFSYARQMRIFQERGRIIFTQFGFFCFLRYLIELRFLKLSRLFLHLFRKKIAKKLGS